jgi:hypothetical protein
MRNPGRRYWAKRQSVMVSEQVPLPDFKDSPVVMRLKLRTTVVDVNHGKQQEGEGRAMIIN